MLVGVQKLQPVKMREPLLLQRKDAFYLSLNAIETLDQLKWYLKEYRVPFIKEELHIQAGRQPTGRTRRGALEDRNGAKNSQIKHIIAFSCQKQATRK